MSIDLKSINKKYLALLIVTLVLVLVAAALGITLVIKMIALLGDEWKLLISFLAIGAAAAGLVAYDVYLIKKLKASSTVSGTTTGS